MLYHYFGKMKKEDFYKLYEDDIYIIVTKCDSDGALCDSCHYYSECEDGYNPVVGNALDGCEKWLWNGNYETVLSHLEMEKEPLIIDK